MANSMNDLIAANLSGEQLQKVVDLEQKINQEHKGNEIYILAFENK